MVAATFVESNVSVDVAAYRSEAHVLFVEIAAIVLCPEE